MTMRRSVLSKNIAGKTVVEQMELGLPNYSSTPILKVVLHQISSPIRRRGSIIKPTIEKVNDDASERRSITAAYNVTPTSSDKMEVRTMSFMRATFQNSVQLFYDDKITRDNVWNIELIENMYTLVLKNDQYVENFQVLSSALAASAKIYGLRVDSIHSDMLRLIVDINKESTKGKPTDASNDTLPNNEDNTENLNVPKKDKKKKKKKNAESYIAQSDDVINGIPDSFECIDSAFQIRTATMGDATTLSNVFVRTLSLSFPNKLELGVTDDLLYKSCEGEDAEEFVDKKGKVFMIDYISTLCTYSDSTNFKLLGWLPPAVDNTSHDANCVLNKTQQDVLFLGVDNVEQPDVLMDEEYEVNDADVDDCPPFDSENNCNVSINDNSDVIHIRQSNRAGMASEFLSNITIRLWAGPNYLRKRMSKITAGGNSEIVKRVRLKRPVVILPQEVKANDAFTNAKNIKLKRAALTQWSLQDTGKQKFPEDLLLEAKEFEHDYEDGKEKAVRFPRNDEYLNTTCVDDAVPPYDYNNEMDTDYCPMVQDERNHYSDDEDVTDQLDINKLDDPDMVDEVNINYAKKAKTIDMKQLKRCIYTTLKDNSDKGINTIQFSEMCKTLSKKIDDRQAEQLTMQIALLALLFVANEKKLILEQQDSADFTISLKQLV